MAMAAVVHRYVFSWHDFEQQIAAQQTRQRGMLKTMTAMKDLMLPHDVVEEARHHFRHTRTVASKYVARPMKNIASLPKKIRFTVLERKRAKEEGEDAPSLPEPQDVQPRGTPDPLLDASDDEMFCDCETDIELAPRHDQYKQAGLA